jgi:serine/threonine protein kinase
MEYGGEQNLKQFIRNREGKLIEENIIKNIINQICLGLKEIHKKKINS